MPAPSPPSPDWTLWTDRDPIHYLALPWKLLVPVFSTAALPSLFPHCGSGPWTRRALPVLWPSPAPGSAPGSSAAKACTHVPPGTSSLCLPFSSAFAHHPLMSQSPSPPGGAGQLSGTHALAPLLCGILRLPSTPQSSKRGPIVLKAKTLMATLAVPSDVNPWAGCPPTKSLLSTGSSQENSAWAPVPCSYSWFVRVSLDSVAGAHRDEQARGNWPKSRHALVLSATAPVQPPCKQQIT